MNKIHISDFVYQYLSDLRIEKDQEAHIRLFAERTGEQVGQIITDIVAEIMALILAGKSATATQLPLSAATFPVCKSVYTLDRSRFIQGCHQGGLTPCPRAYDPDVATTGG
jgi:hypothetical protein